MEAVAIELDAISAISGTSAAPFAQVVVTLTKLEHIQLVMEARCWKSLHRRTVSRLQQPPGATNSPTNSADETKSLSSAGFELLNVDSTIVAQAPKMAPHIPAMRERIAAALGLTPEAVNVKRRRPRRWGRWARRGRFVYWWACWCATRRTEPASRPNRSRGQLHLRVLYCAVICAISMGLVGLPTVPSAPSASFRRSEQVVPERLLPGPTEQLSQGNNLLKNAK